MKIIEIYIPFMNYQDSIFLSTTLVREKLRKWVEAWVFEGNAIYHINKSWCERRERRKMDFYSFHATNELLFLEFHRKYIKRKPRQFRSGSFFFSFKGNTEKILSYMKFPSLCVVVCFSNCGIYNDILMISLLLVCTYNNIALTFECFYENLFFYSKKSFNKFEKKSFLFIRDIVFLCFRSLSL